MLAKQYIRMKNNQSLWSFPTLPNAKITKAQAAIESARLIKKLATIQDKLYGQNKYSVLIVLQGMDTSGKDSTVKRVFSGVNPAGCNVKSFKVPTTVEKAHHFLWRVNAVSPQKGMIQIFNRSHYEDILIPIVHNTLKEKQIAERCDEINAFEQGLINNNTILLKFFLNISHKEQLKRLETRRTKPNKRWKFQEDDIVDINKHNTYRKAYELIFDQCKKAAAWQIIPADKKWFKNYAILHHIVHILNDYHIEYPVLQLNQHNGTVPPVTINKPLHQKHKP